MLLNACKIFGLAVNTGETKYMDVGCHRGMMTNEHITIGSNSYKKERTFKYLISLLTNQNSIHKAINCRLKSANSSYYSIQTLLSSRLLSKNSKIKIYNQLCYMVTKYGPLH